MTSVAELYVHVVGVDTHAKTHTFTIVQAATAQVTLTEVFPASDAGLRRSIDWVVRHSDPARLLVIEGIGSYGAMLAATAQHSGIEVAEAGVIGKADKRGRGKSDELDAIRIARSVLGADIAKLRRPRFDEGIRDALRVSMNSREAQNKERTTAINQLTALLRTTPLGVDARRSLTAAQIKTIAAWRKRDEALYLEVARAEAVRLATRIRELDASLKANKAQLAQLIGSTDYAVLLAEPGCGPISAAQIIIAWGNTDRIGSQASFAGLAGVQPIPASSGNTDQMRLNRGGDRQLNRALHTITNWRMSHDPHTIAYLHRRTAQGKTRRAIRRILKRYLARHIYRLLTQHPAQP